MNVEKQPYEVLIRFGPDGEVRGAHVIWQYVTMDGDKVIASAPGQAEPAGEGGADFPLAKAVSAAIADGLVRSADAAEKLALANEANRLLIERADAMQKDLDATADLIKSMRAEHEEKAAAMSEEIAAVRSAAGLDDDKAKKEIIAQAAAQRDDLIRRASALDRAINNA